MYTEKGSYLLWLWRLSFSSMHIEQQPLAWSPCCLWAACLEKDMAPWLVETSVLQLSHCKMMCTWYKNAGRGHLLLCVRVCVCASVRACMASSASSSGTSRALCWPGGSPRDKQRENLILTFLHFQAVCVFMCVLVLRRWLLQASLCAHGVAWPQRIGKRCVTHTCLVRVNHLHI